MKKAFIISHLLKTIAGARHDNYNRAVEVAEQLKMLTTGEGQDKKLKEIFESEDSERQKQRAKLTNPVTPSIIHQICAPFKRVERVGLSIDTFEESNEESENNSNLESLKVLLQNWNGSEKTLHSYLSEKLRFWNCLDANACVVLSQKNINDELQLQTYVATSENILLYEKQDVSFLWAVIKTSKEGFTLYCDEYSTILEKVEDFEGSKINLTGNYLDNTDYYVTIADDSSKDKKEVYRLNFMHHNIGFCPVKSVGFTSDFLTHGNTYVSFFNPVIYQLLDLIESWSEKWLIRKLHINAGAFIVIPPYKGGMLSEVEKTEICEKKTCKNICKACHQNRHLKVFQLGSQDVVVYELPDIAEDWGQLDAKKFHAYREIPTDSVKYVDEAVEYLIDFIFKTLYGKEEFTNSEVLATSERIKQSYMYDAILDYSNLVLSHLRFWTNAIVKLKRWNITRTVAYPEDMQPQTLEYYISLNEKVRSAKLSDFAAQKIEEGLLSKVFENSPNMLLVYKTWIKHIPILSKTVEEREKLLAIGSIDGITVNNYQRFLYSYLPLIREVIETDDKTKDSFYTEDTFEKQAEIIRAAASKVKVMIENSELFPIDEVIELES